MASSITVIVLSYNGTADTLACLDSLLQDAARPFDILVVDNASTDGAPAAIRARYPDLPLLELEENRGWAGGNNAGIDVALRQGAEFICLLNNDTIVPAGTIATLAAAAKRYAPCLMHPAIDFADPAEGAQLDPSLSCDPVRVDQDGDMFEMEGAYGACLMVPAAVFRSIGKFDERFFLQMEETDFWLRARQRGVRSLCTTAARIIHSESRAFGGRVTPVKTYYIVRNSLLLIEKHYRSPPKILRSLRSLYWSVSQMAGKDNDGRQTISLRAWPLSRDPFLVAMRAGARDYLLRRFGRMRAATQTILASIPLAERSAAK